MCGIFGFDLNPTAITPFQRGMLCSNLARLNDSRGGHSWGFAGAVTKNKYKVEKGLGDFLPSAHKLRPYNKLYGHTRFGTTGDRTIVNSHPFKIGKILGAHNGVLFNHSALSTNYNRKFDVDSMHLFAHLNENMAFDDIDGYGAIEWTEEDKTAIYLCKLDRGDLSVYGLGVVGSPRGVVWSSKEDHLLESLDAAGVHERFEYKIDEGKVYFVQDNKLWVTTRTLNFRSSTDSRMSYWSSGAGRAWSKSGYPLWDENGRDVEDNTTATKSPKEDDTIVVNTSPDVTGAENDTARQTDGNSEMAVEDLSEDELDMIKLVGELHDGLLPLNREKPETMEERMIRLDQLLADGVLNAKQERVIKRLQRSLAAVSGNT